MPLEMGLDKLPLGVPGQITQMAENLPLIRRLNQFGLIPGTQICCRYRTPGGSVTAVEFRGTMVALRTRDMSAIRVQVK